MFRAFSALEVILWRDVLYKSTFCSLAYLLKMQINLQSCKANPSLESHKGK